MRTYDCPTCRKVTEVEQEKDAPYRPFCTERCKLIDLGRWLDGTFTISEPANPQDLEDAASNDQDT